MKYAGIGCLVLLVLAVLIVGGSAVGAYNSLVALDQAAQQAWGQVQNVYQRRADLVPNLVETPASRRTPSPR
jgi:LemA protein